MTLYDKNQEVKEKYKTLENTYDMFPVGTTVKVICLCQDFNFFRGELGIVTNNSGKYLGINVKFDEPRNFEDGSIQTEFNFKPEDLIETGKINWRYCFVSGKYRDKKNALVD